MPPFLGLKIDLPADVLVQKVAKPLLDFEGAAAAVGVIIEILCADQYTDGDALGAWSRAYPSYLHHVFGSDIPSDVSVRESITCSSAIARGLWAIAARAGRNAFTEAAQARIDAFVRYLLLHQHESTGGFGIRGKPTSRGGGHVSVDFRHTAWAMLSLTRFAAPGGGVGERLARAAGSIRGELRALQGERSITYAVLHLLLSTDVVGPLVLPLESERRALLKTIEAHLVASFDSRYGSWDTDRDPPVRSVIDNALFVLQCVDISRCIDSECAGVLRSSYEKLLNYMRGEGLPFDLGGFPNTGATAEFAFLLAHNRRELDVATTDIRRLGERVARDVTTAGADLGYPWHLAQFLRLAAGEA